LLTKQEESDEQEFEEGGFASLRCLLLLQTQNRIDFLVWLGF